ncbi:Beta-galactosidase 3 [Glycine soja]|uniref:Beta-galactosidase 3 n=1 Tax=Glycine soja TaxID=3848 RepID=A0A445L7R6_GLYSO|nr:Beta-galactosidase 3 [Glycine soja]
MEGAYKRALSARQTVPHDTYVYFMDLLAETVRDEIAGCSEKAYDYLSIKDAKQMLLFSSDQELLEYIKEEHPEWEIKNGSVFFQKAKESAPCKEIPSLQLINQTLSYAYTFGQPKYGHFKELHRAIKMSNSQHFEAHVYTTESGDCTAFLSNYDSKSSARVMFNNMQYSLPPWSVSILPDCINVVFNTAKVGVQTSQMQMLPTNTQLFSWESFDEDIYFVDESSAITAHGLLEQINVTKDASDYLWYITSVDIGLSESFLRGGEFPTLIVQSTGHAIHVFINGQLFVSAFGTREYRRFTYTGKVNLLAELNRLALLNVAIGLLKKISVRNAFKQDGLKGEAMDVASPNGISSVAWMQSAIVVQRNQPLTWHKTYFDAPEGDEPLALDMEGMGKGQIWING